MGIVGSLVCDFAVPKANEDWGPFILTRIWQLLYGLMWVDPVALLVHLKGQLAGDSGWRTWCQVLSKC